MHLRENESPISGEETVVLRRGRNFSLQVLNRLGDWDGDGKIVI